jgi:hypothetical protein
MASGRESVAQDAYLSYALPSQSSNEDRFLAEGEKWSHEC